MKRIERHKILFVGLMVVLCAGIDDRESFSAESPKVGGREQLSFDEPKLLTASIYDREKKQLLYRFKRVANRSGSVLNVQRDFTYPDGKLAARESVTYEGKALVSYELEEVQIGAHGSARIRRVGNNPARATVEFEYTKAAGSRTKVRAETLQENTLIADTVGPFLASHWDALRRGEKVKCRYIVVPRAETVGFTFSRDSEARHGDQAVLLVKMEPSSTFVAALLAPLLFTIEEAPPHRVLQYVGRTTPKVQNGGKWRDWDAVTVFDWGTAK